jgi:hypothetical protein
MKVGRQCRDCLVTIHKKCEDKYNTENICTHEPIHLKLNPIASPSEDDLKSLVNIEINNNIPVVTSDEIETVPVKLNDELVVNRTTTANRLQTKAAAAFSVLDSTARRSFRAFGHKSSNQIATPPLSTTSELSKSDESLNNASPSSTKKSPTTNPPPPPPPPPPVQSSSKLVNAASSAYSKLREFKSKRTPATSESNPVKKNRIPSDTGRILNDLFK